MRRDRYFYLFIVSCLYMLTAFSATYFVDSDRMDDSGNGLSWMTAKMTLSGVLSVEMLSGDQIFVKEGTYNDGMLSVNSGIELYGGFAGTESSLTERNYILHPTIIDAGGDPVGFVSMEGILDGFSVTNAGSVAVDNQTSTGVIRNCRIYGHSGFLDMETVIVNGFMSNCLIYGNMSSNSAVSVYSGGSIHHCTIANNSGYGIAVDSSALVQNCIVSQNGTGAMTNLNGASNSMIVNNTLLDGVVSSFFYNGSGVIFGPVPVFVNPTPGQDADYRLAAGSSGIDAGVASVYTTDYYGLTRPYESATPDMGACEYNAPPAVTVTTSSPIQLAHNATEFTLEGGYSDPENAMQFLSFSVNSGTPMNVDVSGHPWSQALTITDTAQVQVTGYDVGYAPSAVVSDTFVVQTVLPSCFISTPSGSVTIPKSQTSLNVDVNAADDNAVSEILYRLESADDWSSSTNFSDNYWHLTLDNLPVGSQDLYVKAIDADGYESDVDRLIILRLPERVYVDINKAFGSEDGLSWATAYSSISDALADYSGNSLDFWVADGTYQEGDTITVAVSDTLYGGFAGTETALDQRDFSVNKTIIDGENTYQCVYNSGLLDGLYITKGFNDTSWVGAGIYNANSGTVRNCDVYDNHMTELPVDISSSGGGGIYNDGGTVEYCHVYLNSVNQRGGGIRNSGTVRYCEIYDNECLITPAYGGGVYNNGSLSDSSIYRNSNRYSGGGVYSNGSALSNLKIYENQSAYAGGIHSLVDCYNSQIYRNTASLFGGGAYIYDSNLYNCTVYDNESPFGAGVYGSGEIYNSIIWANAGDDLCDNGEGLSSYNCCYQAYDFTGDNGDNISSDPLFVNVSGEISTWDFTLQDGSPCVDAGNTSYIYELTDIDGNDRPGTDGFMCMGSIESPDVYTQGIPVDPPSPVQLFVDEAGDDSDGSSWEKAFTNLEDAVQYVSDQYMIHCDIWVSLDSCTLSKTLGIPHAINLYGGFAGTESSLDERDLSVTGKTLLDAGDQFRAVVNGGLIDGFSITGGFLDSLDDLEPDSLVVQGSGVCNFGSVVNCEIYGCSSTGIDSGPALLNVGPAENIMIYDNTSEENVAGVWCYSSRGVLNRAWIYSNRSTNGVGGLLLEQDTKVENALIYANSSDVTYGGVSSLKGSLTHTTIFNNSSPDGVAGVKLILGTFSNSIVWGHDKDIDGILFNASNSCYSESNGLNNCISLDPMFVQASGDPATWDLSLQAGSPCIDQADKDLASSGVDILNAPRPIGSNNDMGAFEYNEAPEHTVTSPTENQTVPFAITSYGFDGTCSDAFGSVTDIEYNNNGGVWQAANLVTNAWSFTAPLSVGDNVILVRAKDEGNMLSTPSGYTVTRSANQAPSVSITSPVSNITVDQSVGAYLIEGTAFDSDGNISALEYRVNGSGWSDLTIETNWSMNAFLLPGDNLFEVRALDDAATYGGTDTYSDIVSVTITRPINQIYINQASTATFPDGYSWAKAYPSILQALPHQDICSTFWVASGTYQEGSPITITDAVDIYGGFAGTESSVEDRDIESNRSVLDGENTYPVVFNNGILNGFDITNGQSSNSGGGIVNEASGTVEQCRIFDNQSSAAGGGIYNKGTLSRSEVFSNSADAGAGGVENEGRTVNAVIYGNTGLAVGGVQNTGSVVNSTIYGNDGSSPGGILNQGNTMNSIIWGNTSSGNPSDVVNSGSITFCCYSEADGTNNNISDDPLFNNVSGDISTWRLFPNDSSPCISAGTDTDGSLTAPNLDITGFARPYGGYEMGAYEMNTAPIVTMTDPATDIDVPFSVVSYDLAGFCSDIESEVQSVEYRWNSNSWVAANLDQDAQTFTFSSSLITGTNTFYVHALDTGLADGYYDRYSENETVSITRLENVPPTGEITNPTQDLDVDVSVETFTITGTANDSDGLISSVVCQREYTAYTYPVIGTTDWSVEVPLDDGSNTFQIYAYDNASEYGADEDSRNQIGYVSIYRESNKKPLVNITQPAMPAIVVDLSTGTYSVSGTVSDQDGTVSSVSALVNNIAPSDLTGLENWSFTANLAPGVNTIEVKAYDDADTLGLDPGLGKDTCTIFCPVSRIYIDQSSTASMPDGNSWATAFPTIQQALNLASVDQEFWVADGTYLITDTITIASDMIFLGGFSGDETDRAQRDFTMYESIIDGGDAVLCVNNLGIIDGFHITNGNDSATQTGGGIYNDGIVINCNIYGNICQDSNNSDAGGGGIYNDENGTVEYCNVYENTANQFGGGVFNKGQIRNTDIYNNALVNDKSDAGGLYNYYNSTASDCLIYGNTANRYGGGIYTYSPVSNMRIHSNTAAAGGGLATDHGGSVEVVNCLIYENTATANGGGVFLDEGRIVHCTIYSNHAPYNGGVCPEDGAEGEILNSIIWYNEGGDLPGDYANITTISCCYYDPIRTMSPTDIALPPEFVNVSGPLFTWDFSLKDGSPCVDAGTLNTNVPLFDAFGSPRPGGDGTPCLGALESPDGFEADPSASMPVRRIYLAASGDNTDGSSWEHAFTDFQYALEFGWNQDDSVYEVWCALDQVDLIHTAHFPHLLKFYGGLEGSETSLVERGENTTILNGLDTHQCAVNHGQVYNLTFSHGYINQDANPIDDYEDPYIEADYNGAGIFNYGYVEDCEVVDSTAAGSETHSTCANGGILIATDIHGNHSDRICGSVVNVGAVDRCRVFNNTCADGTGGIYNGPKGAFVNSTIYDNTSTRFALGAMNSQNGSIVNCTIYGNVGDPSLNAIVNAGTVSNSISYGHTIDYFSEGGTIAFSCFSGAEASDGNIDSDPLFVNTSGDSSTWNLSLQESSPCKDTADSSLALNAWDLRGFSRPMGTQYEMGAYEVNLVPELSINTPDSDISVPYSIVSYDLDGISSDTDGDIRNVEYRNNSGTWQVASGTANWNFSLSLDEGANVIDVRAIDNGADFGHEDKITLKTVTITRSPNVKPTANILSDTSAQSFAFTTTSFGINGTAADSDGEVSLIRYRNNGGPWMNGTGTDTWSINADLQVGENNFVVQVVDNARDYGSLTNGLTSYALETMTRAANTAPELNVVTASQTVDFSRMSLNVTGTVTDTDCGLRTFECQVNGAGWNTLTPTGDDWSYDLTLAQGDNIFEVRAIDRGADYGESNLSTTQSITITRSANVGPEGSIVTPTQDETVPFTSTSFGFNGTASDIDGNVSVVEYRNNGGNWMSATGTDNWGFSAALVTGTNSIIVRAADNATAYGAAENAFTTLGGYTITRTANVAPELQVVTTTQTVDFSHMSLTVTGTVTDTDCGLRTLEYQVNSGGWNGLTPTGDDWSYDLTLAEGDNVFEVRATDCGADYGDQDLSSSQSITITRSGNVGPEGSIIAPEQDVTLPFVTMTSDFNGTAADSDGTVTAVEYRNNGGSWMAATGTEAWNFSAALLIGANSIEVRATDNASDYGAAENAFTSLGGYTITRTANVAPELQVVTTTQTVDFSHMSLTVTGTVTDTDCGLRSFEYQVNGAGWNGLTPTGDDWSYDLTLAEGDNVFEVRATDCGADYGDQDLSSSQSITITRSPNVLPTGQITDPAAAMIYVDFNQMDYLVTGTAGDEDGSVSEVQYQINSGEWFVASGTTQWQMTAPLVANITNTITVRAYDNASDYGAAENGSTYLGTAMIWRNANQAPMISVAQPTQSTLDVDCDETTFDFSGIAGDSDGTVRAVEYRQDSGSWMNATGTDSWNFQVNLNVGANQIDIRAMDNAADFGGTDTPSEIASYTITRAENGAPIVTIEAPVTDGYVRFDETPQNFSGTASDEDGTISSVQYRNNGGSWISATGTDNWTFSFDLEIGENIIEVRALDDQDLASSMKSRTFTRLNELTADFTVDVTSAEEDTLIHFNDASTGDLETWSWDFDNDGTIDSIETNPSWIYEDPGLYTVSLTVTDMLSEKTITKTGLMSIYPIDAVDYDSSLMLSTIPTVMSQGETYYVELTLKNIGRETWLNDELIYLGAVDNSDPLATSRFLRVDIFGDVRYGEEVTFRIEMKPADAGVHTTDWQMIYEDNFWFGEVVEEDVYVEQKTAVEQNNWIIYQ